MNEVDAAADYYLTGHSHAVEAIAKMAEDGRPFSDEAAQLVPDFTAEFVPEQFQEVYTQGWEAGRALGLKIMAHTWVNYGELVGKLLERVKSAGKSGDMSALAEAVAAPHLLENIHAGKTIEEIRKDTWWPSTIGKMYGHRDGHWMLAFSNAFNDAVRKYNEGGFAAFSAD